MLSLYLQIVVDFFVCFFGFLVFLITFFLQIFFFWYLVMLFWIKGISVVYNWVSGFPGGSVVKNLPAMQEMKFQSLDQKDPLEEEMETHSNILAWEIPCPAEPDGLKSMRLQKSWTRLSDWACTHTRNGVSSLYWPYAYAWTLHKCFSFCFFFFFPFSFSWDRVTRASRS